MKKFGLFVRGGNNHPKLAFTLKAKSAVEAMKSCVWHYNYKLGVDTNKMETFYVVPYLEDLDLYDIYSEDANGWDIGDTFFPNWKYAHCSPTHPDYKKPE